MIRYALAALLLASTAQARTLEVGDGKEFKLPSEAAKAARTGDTIQIQPGEYFDCAILGQAKLTVEGVGDPAKVLITDKACQGKALFITTAPDITIRNLTLTRARVADGNGAGIRMEAPGLVVERVRFVNNQNGILTGIDGGTLTVRDSDFVHNGTCEQSCAHAIYAGHLELLRVERSRFSDTRQGHSIKSRALRTEIIGNTINDGPTGTASYLVDISNGGSVVVQGNTLVKGANAENHTGAVMIGMEGVTQPTREITIEDNNFRNDGTYPTYFVVNRTATDAVLRRNTLSGSAKPLSGDGAVQ